MLRTFLPSVVRYSKGEGIEVCVADNGSTDASVEMPVSYTHLIIEKSGKVEWSVLMLSLRMQRQREFNILLLR